MLLTGSPAIKDCDPVPADEVGLSTPHLPANFANLKTRTDFGSAGFLLVTAGVENPHTHI